MKWIKVEDKLPNICQDVIVFEKFMSCETIKIGHLLPSDYWVDDHLFPVDRVTHWMPLPNPPEEENEYDKILQDVIDEGNKRMCENTWMPLRENASDGGE